MDVTYYPGCSLEATARDYDESIRAVCAALGIRLLDLEDWTCCGATSAHATSDRLAVMLPAINLPAAEKAGLPVLAPCPLCFNRLKRAQKPVGSTVKVLDLCALLASEQVLSAIGSLKKVDLSALKAVCYYGCMANRPPKEVGSEDYENPVNMDRIALASGVTVIDWSYKTDCCGASFAVSMPSVMTTLVKKLYDKALEAGAECILVACQMCQANLDMYQERMNRDLGTDYHIPIIYISEIVGMALSLDKPGAWLSRHLTDSLDFLSARGIQVA
jgi:heterodisulfide reductase subunit B